MNRWLVKTEPNEYSFADLASAVRDRWDGVKNPLALKHMRSMKPGDLVMVYHTGNVRAVVGLAQVVSDPYPDPDANDEKLVVVDLEATRPLSRPVTLAEIKADPAFQEWELVRNSRLSVMPVPEELWERILSMS